MFHLSLDERVLCHRIDHRGIRVSYHPREQGHEESSDTGSWDTHTHTHVLLEGIYSPGSYSVLTVVTALVGTIYPWRTTVHHEGHISLLEDHSIPLRITIFPECFMGEGTLSWEEFVASKVWRHSPSRNWQVYCFVTGTGMFCGLA